MVVLDESLSLQAVEDGAPRWNRALQAAKDALKSLQSGDRAALVSCAGRGAGRLRSFAGGGGPRATGDSEAHLGRRGSFRGNSRGCPGWRPGIPRASSSVVVVSDFQRTGAGALGNGFRAGFDRRSAAPGGRPGVPEPGGFGPVDGRGFGRATGAGVVHHGDRDIAA